MPCPEKEVRMSPKTGFILKAARKGEPTSLEMFGGHGRGEGQ